MPPLPTSRLRRAAHLSRTGVRATAALVSGGEAWAEALADGLGELRGLATKVGQMASYLEGLAPTDPVAARALARLRAQAARSAPSEVRAVVEAELGAPVEALFAAWDDEPLASASLGQVHAARLGDGREVVVKVQHPGVAEAVAGDLAQARALGSTVAAVTRGLPVGSILDEVEARLLDELDYRTEAAAQARYAEAFSGDEEVGVPGVVPERSAARVLTGERAGGLGVDDAGGAPEGLRSRWVGATWRAFIGGALRTGLLHGDPHPGNLLLQPGGGVVLLDYGCVQPLSPADLAAVRALFEAGARGDRTRLRAVVGPLAGSAAFADALAAVWEIALPPAGVVRVDRGRARRLGEAMLLAKRPSLLLRGGAAGMAPWFALAHRTFLGLASALAPLDAEADLGGIALDELARDPRGAPGGWLRRSVARLTEPALARGGSLAVPPG